MVVDLGYGDALGERAKRRLVGFVPQRFHPALVKRLLGTDPVNPAQEPAHFGREPFFAGRIQQRGERLGRQRLQYMRALPVMVADVVRIGVEIHFVVELLQRTVQMMLDHQLRDDLARAGPRDVPAARFPQHDVQDHIIELAVAFVAVMVPILRPQMNLHVARALNLVADLQCRMPKIGAGLQIPPALEHHADATAIRRLQRAGVQPLVVPDALHQPFADGDRDVIAVGITKDGGRIDVRKTPTHEFVAQFAVAG